MESLRYRIGSRTFFSAAACALLLQSAGCDVGSSILVPLSDASATDAPLSDVAMSDRGTDVPATDVPATDVPATDVPATDGSATDVLATDVLATDVPATDVPATDVSATDVSATDVSATDVPAMDVPAMDVPAMDVPVMDVPAMDVPARDVPATDVPATLTCGSVFATGFPMCMGQPSFWPCLTAFRTRLAGAELTRFTTLTTCVEAACGTNPTPMCASSHCFEEVTSCHPICELALSCGLNTCTGTNCAASFNRCGMLVSGTEATLFAAAQACLVGLCGVGLDPTCVSSASTQARCGAVIAACTGMAMPGDGGVPPADGGVPPADAPITCDQAVMCILSTCTGTNCAASWDSCGMQAGSSARAFLEEGRRCLERECGLTLANACVLMHRDCLDDCGGLPLCAAGTTRCGGTCVNLLTDTANCGECGNTCLSGATCTAGVCAGSCAAGQSLCGGTCVNLLTSAANCGTCNAPCPATTACMSGTCVGTGTCSPPQTQCGSSCVSLQTNPAHCGSCSNSCNSAQTCVNGNCVGTGALRFTLTWDRAGDVDLHVTPPCGTNIYYSVRNRLICDGTLDRDDQTGLGPENVYFNDTAARGEYLLCVIPYSITGSTTATLRVFEGTVLRETFTRMFASSMATSLCSRSSPYFVGTYTY